MFMCLLWDVKKPTHYSKRAEHEVPGVVAVLCESMGTEKVICLAWDLVSRTHITLYFGEKAEKNKNKKQEQKQKHSLRKVTITFAVKSIINRYALSTSPLVIQ